MSVSLIIPVVNVPKHIVIGRIINRVLQEVTMLFFKIIIVSRSSTLVLCTFSHQSLKPISNLFKIHHQAQAKEDCSHDRYGDEENTPVALGDREGSEERKAKSAESTDEQARKFFGLFRRHFLFCHNTLNTMKYMTYLIAEWRLNVNIFSTIHITKIGDKT